ncbi:hypothetical protein PF005_g17325 [Phytophthora fragariae]|uniref:Uncharacterized protein n=1 Tax=Phytophthora fragariae TaxID=53985 RepID=A0A6A4D055_9STRA|nr:hypothetical protein PF009_g18063 [Phytophthora fragariae]KAE8994578.1 hypothetical protein PF011_g16680 [Phytophthora fragariae]KAE9095701.1 hypothetical protein PF010_g16610 [Phytophthora fragariae]KAE9096360.1 hypothetical protein PF007_g17032 [Phytophthora fragariae]KAE9128970.1 hypothetical protein PF006_g16147 [Phytophthora fragariae]
MSSLNPRLPAALRCCAVTVNALLACPRCLLLFVLARAFRLCGAGRCITPEPLDGTNDRNSAVTVRWLADCRPRKGNARRCRPLSWRAEVSEAAIATDWPLRLQPFAPPLQTRLLRESGLRDGDAQFNCVPVTNYVVIILA